MSLKGDVETLSLLEIFDVLHASGHSGILAVSNETISKGLHFYKGLLYYPKDRAATYKLGNLLLRTTALTQAQLDQGLAIQKTKRRRLGETLVSEGFVSQEDVDRVVANQYKEEVFDLFLWKRARFEFQKNVLPQGFRAEIEAGHMLTLQPTNVIMEAANRIDEWKRIHKAIPSLKLICAEDPGAGGKVAKALAQAKIDPKVAPFDGRRNLQTIFDAWQHTFFDSHRIVFQLLDQGAIQPLPAPRIEYDARQAMAKKDFAHAIRLYETACECTRDDALISRLTTIVYGEKGIRVVGPDTGFQIRGTGKRALSAFLDLFREGTTGCLSIVEGDNQRVLTLEDEALGVGTYGANVTPEVVHYVARRGLMTPEEVEEATKKRAETGRSIQAILLEDGYIDRADWVRVLTDKLVDEIYDVFFWNEPKVELRAGADPSWSTRPPKLQLRIPFSVTGFLDELRAHLADIQLYLEEVPSVRAVFKDAREAAEGRDVISLFDGRKSVQAILASVRGARQDLLHLIHRALGAGKLRPLTPEEYQAGVDAAIAGERFQEAQTLCWSAIDCGVERERFERKLEEARYAEEEAVEATLEGDFESISLAEILQSFQRKKVSGTLDVTDGTRVKTIYFQTGDVYVLRREEEKSDFASDFLDTDAVKQFSQTFGGDLVEKGLVNEDELSEFESLQIKEEIWEMFLWEGATFVFARNKLPPDFFQPPKGTQRLMLRTDAFMLEAIRRITEWEDLKRRIPDAGVVFRFVSPELKMRAITEKGSPEVLYLFDGRRSLAEVIRVSGYGRTDVYRLVATLEEESALGRVAPEDLPA